MVQKSQTLPTVVIVPVLTDSVFSEFFEEHFKNLIFQLWWSRSRFFEPAAAKKYRLRNTAWRNNPEPEPFSPAPAPAKKYDSGRLRLHNTAFQLNLFNFTLRTGTGT